MGQVFGQDASTMSRCTNWQFCFTREHKALCSRRQMSDVKCALSCFCCCCFNFINREKLGEVEHGAHVFAGGQVALYFQKGMGHSGKVLLVVRMEALSETAQSLYELPGMLPLSRLGQPPLSLPFYNMGTQEWLIGDSFVIIKMVAWKQ